MKFPILYSFLIHMSENFNIFSKFYSLFEIVRLTYVRAVKEIWPRSLRRYRCVTSVSEGRPRGARVIREHPDLRRAWPRGSADENLQRRKHCFPRTNPSPRHQAPAPLQAEPLASDDHANCEVILTHRCAGAHPASLTHDSNEATLDTVGHLTWSLSQWANWTENSEGGCQKC